MQLLINAFDHRARKTIEGVLPGNLEGEIGLPRESIGTLIQNPTA
jgi:hypothetical protein